MSTIVDFAKEKNLENIKLHLGCGGNNLQGWINIDFYDEKNDSSRRGFKPDILMDIRKLDIDDNLVDEIYMSHVLEHFYRWESINLLKMFYKILKVDGKLTMEHPDLDGCIKFYLDKQNNHLIKTPIGKLNKGFTQFYGNQWDENCSYESHKYVWTKSEIRDILIQIGFKILELHNNTTTHVPIRDMRVVAIK